MKFDGAHAHILWPLTQSMYVCVYTFEYHEYMCQCYISTLVGCEWQCRVAIPPGHASLSTHCVLSGSTASSAPAA